ncbi:copper-binding protein [Planctomycetota bacterium]|nr:copper-binding protein [Planctomycetota bacterium]
MQNRAGHTKIGQLTKITAVVGVLVGGLAIIGCEKKENPQPAEVVVGPAIVSEGEVYEVRGEVVAMPDEKGRMKLHHEAIPSFKNKRGEEVGMMSMTMPFPVQEDVELGEIKEGDKVKATFVVTWGETPYYISKIEQLPETTELNYSSKSKESGEHNEHAEHQMGEHVGEHTEKSDSDESHTNDNDAGHEHESDSDENHR